ncbi:TetR/AcrR family transcriptional regulator [Aestuariicella hydrocarbonica]|uniref:TetR/AcrR family transcriptional regulator n=1 Tax=Pseudomaricurvus hydrocarbonicus TaxID=1470433 RepID=A0A9E5K040_9GAMM|nr:TetR/AcrR family transcriptional regulator [Aestuariicella hydrocarbonica]NHO65987.1 TetR/AcrR family transcriptional regulator [Aestuariicella hydrocarbonica]
MTDRKPPKKVTEKSPPKKSTVRQRVGSEQSATRALILDATERLMLESGYAAVSSRRVAKSIDVKPSLIHYYFPTTDDLFLAVFRRAVEATVEKQDGAFKSSLPLGSLWANFLDPDRTAIAMEFMALASHREAIKREIASYTQHTRQRRAKLLEATLNHEAAAKESLTPAGLNLLLLAVARTLVMEESLGITAGHEDVKSYISALIDRVQNESCA